MTKIIATGLFGLTVLASGCSQLQTTQDTSTIISERVPINVAARMRDNQPLTPQMMAEAKERRIPLNGPVLRPAIDMEAKPVIRTVEAPVLRSAPKAEAKFVASDYEVELFEAAKKTVETDLKVELFTEAIAPVKMGPVDPRETAFLKLNGPSDSADWTTCETDRGYILAIDDKLHLDPGFEVCMRNKGYVMSHEISGAEETILTAESVGRQEITQTVSAPVSIETLP